MDTSFDSKNIAQEQQWEPPRISTLGSAERITNQIPDKIPNEAEFYEYEGLPYGPS